MNIKDGSHNTIIFNVSFSKMKFIFALFAIMAFVAVSLASPGTFGDFEPQDQQQLPNGGRATGASPHRPSPHLPIPGHDGKTTAALTGD